MNTETVQPPAKPQTPRAGVHGFFQQHVVLPLINLLRVGATPRRLAWSLAVGAVIGINPIVGSTTLLCLLVAFVFRLNLIASQITNHILFPLQLALVIVYFRAGEMLFGTGPVPMKSSAFVHALRHRDWSTVHLLWTWEWHALVVWLVAAAILAPVLANILCPMLDRLLKRIHKEQA